MKTRLSLAACAALLACAPGQYRSADGTLAPGELVAQCEYEAEKATASATDPNPLAGPMGGAYALTNNSAMRRASLEQKCMKMKGYEIR